MTQTQRQIIDSLKESIQAEAVAETSTKAEATSVSVSVVEKAAEIYLEKKPVEYAVCPGEKKAQLGALAELAKASARVVRPAMSCSEWEALGEALDGDYNIEGDQAARARRDRLKAGFRADLTQQIKRNKRAAAQLQLEKTANQYRIDRGLSPKKNYTDNDLQAHCELAAEKADTRQERGYIKLQMGVCFDNE